MNQMINYDFVALPRIYKHLSGNELKVFVTMFDQWSKMKDVDGWYYRSQKQLCEDSGLPLRTLQRTIKKLSEKGVIFTTTYNDGVKMATYNKANEYKINMEKVIELSKEKGVKMAEEGCQNGVPIKNKENKNKINNTHYSNVTIDTLQVSGVDTFNDERIIDDFEDELWAEYEVKRSGECYIQSSDDVVNITNSDELGKSALPQSDVSSFVFSTQVWDELKRQAMEMNNKDIQEFKRILSEMLELLKGLYLNGENSRYVRNCKDAISWYCVNRDNLVDDFLFAGGDFKRDVERGFRMA